jgi:hypothetical protein
MSTTFSTHRAIFSVDEYLTAEIDIPPSEIVWESPEDDREGAVQIVSHAINIVSNPNVRDNVARSIAMAIDLAASGMRVLYVNGYAGPVMMRECLAAALDKAPLAEALRVNLKIMQASVGNWNEHLALEEITNGGYTVTWKEPADAIVLNSFEFAAIDIRQKRNLARQLVQFQQKYNLTLVIFTQETRRDLAPGMAARGPIGYLVTLSATVSRIELQKAQIKPKMKDVHEFTIDTDNINIYTDGVNASPYSLLSDSAQEEYDARAEWEREAPDPTGREMDEYITPWPHNAMIGRDLAAIAKYPLLKQFYSERPETVFYWSGQPTEWGLSTRG